MCGKQKIASHWVHIIVISVLGYDFKEYVFPFCNVVVIVLLFIRDVLWYLKVRPFDVNMSCDYPTFPSPTLHTRYKIATNGWPSNLYTV